MPETSTAAEHGPPRHGPPGPPRGGLGIWSGMSFPAWLGLLRRNRFAIDPPYRRVAVKTTALSFLSTLLAFVQEMLYRRQVAHTKIDQPPLFVLGHWRCGTTYLFDLLALDPRHVFPTAFQCWGPNHFLLTEPLLRLRRGSQVSGHRAMDNVPTGPNQPREDEYALASMGVPSTYLDQVFPNAPPHFPEYLDLEAVRGWDRTVWKRALRTFLQRLQYRAPGRRIILKSPTHTARIKIILEMFPDARFVHIVRNPFDVYSSSIKMMKALSPRLGLQVPRFEHLQETIFRNYVHVYRKLEEGQRLVDPSRFHEIHYEELVRDPVGELRKIYQHLGVGDFEPVRPHVERYLAELGPYQTSRYEMPAELKAEVTRHWGEVIRRYGYAGELTSDK